MDNNSSFHDAVEFIAPPSVDEKLFGENSWLNLKLEFVIIYGSLSRPPEVSSSLFPWRNFTGLVCLWLQASLSNHISFGNLSVEDVVALWRTLESRFVHREGELRLAQYMQHHEYHILRSGFELYSEDCCMFLHLESLISKRDVMKLVHFDGLRVLGPHMSVVFDGFHATAIDDHAFWRYDHREGELRLDVLKLLEYGIDNGWLVMLLEHPVSTSETQSLELFSKECDDDSLILIFHLCKFTRLRLFIKILVGCFVRLLFSVGERFKQEVYPHTFQDVLCVDIVSKRNIYRKSHQVAAVNQLLIWFVIFLPRMKKETSFFTSWLIYNDSYASSRYVTSQGEFRSTFIPEALRLMLLWLSLVYLDEQQMVKQLQFYLWLIRSQEGAAICVSKELFSVTSTWSLLEIILITMMHNSNDNGDFARQCTLFDVGCEVYLQGQRGDCFFPYFSHKLEHNFSKLESLFGPQIGACISQGMALKIVAHSGGLHTIHWFFFGSLTRPPES